MEGRELTPWLIRYGYEQGAFPMTIEDGSVEWFQPLTRCIFPISGIRVSRSLGRVLRSGRFRVTFDQAFPEVMRACLRPGDNWISEDFIRVYTQIHHESWAHSCEVWDLQGNLVGGLYGLSLGACFCAESMFHRQTDASKVALHAMVSHCRDLSYTIFDAQVMNPHLASLGAIEIPHEEYMHRLGRAVCQPDRWRSASLS